MPGTHRLDLPARPPEPARNIRSLRKDLTTQARDRIFAAGQALLDLFYPPRCPGCGRIGSVFCAACWALVEPIVPPVCRHCGRPTLPATSLGPATFTGGSDGLCEVCQHIPSNLDGIVVAAIFSDPLRQAIHSLKYQDGRALAVPLGEFMAQVWQRAGLPADLMLPVPLHPSRQAERGYNQSALLTRVLGATSGVPVAENVLIRQRATLPQVGLDPAQRQQNVTGAFVCRGELKKGLRVVLVDDVCTTGSTLEACAMALRASGAAAVWGFTLARPRWHPAGADDS